MNKKVLIIALLVCVSLGFHFRKRMLNAICDNIVKNPIFIHKVIDELTDNYRSPYGPENHDWKEHLKKVEVEKSNDDSSE